MIENYKGWDITLNWDNKDYLERDTTKNNYFAILSYAFLSLTTGLGGFRSTVEAAELNTQDDKLVVSLAHNLCYQYQYRVDR